jgi:hypothetical protein
MAWTDAINVIVNRYSGSSGGTASAPADPHADYCDVAEAAPPAVMADALAQTFRSDETPSFPEMVSSLFRESDPNQRAGLLNPIFRAIGPAALVNIPGLRDLAGNIAQGQSVTPQQASQVSAEQVQQAAVHAQRSDPSIVDHVSSFDAQHPNVVKALGGAAIAIAPTHLAAQMTPPG